MDESEESEESDSTPLSEKEILTIFEAAEVCGVETAVIREGLSNDELSAVKTQKGYEIPRSELIKYCATLEKNSSQPESKGSTDQ